MQIWKGVTEHESAKKCRREKSWRSWSSYKKGKLKRNHKKPEKSKFTLRISNKLSYKI